MSPSSTRPSRRLILALCLLALPLLVGAAAAVPAAAAGWEEQSSGMGESTWLETVCAISTSEAWIGGSPPSVLLHTTDGGAYWYGVGVPITGDLQSMAFIGQAGWVSAHDYGGAGYNYDVHTTDGGQNWVDRPPPLATGTVDRFLPTGPDTCWGWRNLGNAAPKAQLLLTTDGGLTWAGNAAWATGGYIQPSAGSFVSPQSVWFLADSTVYRTTDNGASWSVSDPAAPSYLSYIDFVSATTGWVANGDGYVARTTDTGASWQAVPLPISRQVEAIDFFDAANGWVTTADGTVWHTTNGGTTWGAPAYKTGKILLDVSAAGASDAWISGTQGLILHTSRRRRAGRHDPADGHRRGTHELGRHTGQRHDHGRRRRWHRRLQGAVEVGDRPRLVAGLVTGRRAGHPGGRPLARRPAHPHLPRHRLGLQRERRPDDRRRHRHPAAGRQGAVLGEREAPPHGHAQVQD